MKEFFMNFNGQWSKGGKPVKTFPIQDTRGKTEVPLEVAEEAYKEYAELFGKQQSLGRLGERGGFGAAEIATLLFYRCKRLTGE